MGEFYVMHGPQGQLQKVGVGGREYVAVWPDMLSALRYKARQPELLSFWTVPLDRRLYERKFTRPGGDDESFYLMSGADPGLEVARGRALGRAEIEERLYPAGLRAGAWRVAHAPAGGGRHAAV